MPDSLMDNDSKGMTSLHRAAQQALAQNLKIMLPNHPLGFGGGRYKFSKVALEAPVGNRRVDCLGIGEGMVGTLYEKIKVAIEIRVTNPVDGDKLAELQEHDLNAVVEIDLSSLSKTEWDADTLEFDVCDSAKNIKWLYSDKDKAYAKIYEEREVEASAEW